MTADLLVVEADAPARPVAGAYEAVLGCPDGEALVGSKELKQFVRLLQQQHESVAASHRALTAAWQGPLSLFGATAEARAVEQGVPPWAVAAVHTAQDLVDEAAELGDLTDVYNVQLVMAVREGHGLLRAPLQGLIEYLDDLSMRLTAHVPAMILARMAFDKQEGVKADGAQQVPAALKHTGLMAEPHEREALRVRRELLQLHREALQVPRKDLQLPLAILKEKSQFGEIPEWLLQMAMGAGRGHAMRSDNPALWRPAATTLSKLD
mmetsp:Transcript_127188/g.231099  ORF Transcript_127188/g.231099 Transcript_127188/m.231099 type:complete len:266 (-) Transcript_127188:153-950(-)